MLHEAAQEARAVLLLLAQGVVLVDMADDKARPLVVLGAGEAMHLAYPRHQHRRQDGGLVHHLAQGLVADGAGALEVVPVGVNLKTVEEHRLHTLFPFLPGPSGEGNDLGGLEQSRFLVLGLDEVDHRLHVLARQDIGQAGVLPGQLGLGAVALLERGGGVKGSAGGGG